MEHRLCVSHWLCSCDIIRLCDINLVKVGVINKRISALVKHTVTQTLSEHSARQGNKVVVNALTMTINYAIRVREM